MDRFLRIVHEEYKRTQGLLSRYESRAKDLEGYSGLRLCMDNRGGEPHYTVYRRKGSTPDSTSSLLLPPGRDSLYLGRRDMDSVERISEAALCGDCIELLGRNKTALRKFMREYRAFDAVNVLADLPEAYREGTRVYPESLNEKARKWVREGLALREIHPPAYPERLIHRAADGELMRSISETDITQYLIDRNYPYVYERPLMLGGVYRHPDLTVYLPATGRVKFIEYMGRMDDPEYEKRANARILEYIEAGYEPYRDFLCLFGGREGRIDMEAAAGVLAVFLTL